MLWLRVPVGIGDGVKRRFQRTSSALALISTTRQPLERRATHSENLLEKGWKAVKTFYNARASRSLVSFSRLTQSVKKLTAGAYKKTLDALTRILEEAEAERTITLERFEHLAEIIKGIFSHKGIELTKSITFGDPLNAVRSELFSAGEKQFLSFLCYNAFLTDSVVIIDEPEISLHPDWQRRLIPTLKSQNSRNQFILTTHSPFIYSKFPQREICLSNDKGE